MIVILTLTISIDEFKKKFLNKIKQKEYGGKILGNYIMVYVKTPYMNSFRLYLYAKIVKRKNKNLVKGIIFFNPFGLLINIIFFGIMFIFFDFFFDYFGILLAGLIIFLGLFSTRAHPKKLKMFLSDVISDTDAATNKAKPDKPIP